MDPAKIEDKISRYTGDTVPVLEIHEIQRGKKRVAGIAVESASVPIVFVKPGTYSVPGGRQKTAFGQGTIYFRHGAKSAPANSKDLTDSFLRGFSRMRKQLLGNLRKVVHAPIGHKLSILPPGVFESENPSATPIRIVTDPRAPAYQKLDPDKTHPYRRKEVLDILNRELKGKVSVNSFDFLCVRSAFKIDQKKEFFYRPKFASPQYSPAFVSWILEQSTKDNEFFEKAKRRHKKSTSGN